MKKKTETNQRDQPSDDMHKITATTKIRSETFVSKVHPHIYFSGNVRAWKSATDFHFC